MPPVQDDTATINGRAYRWQVVGMLRLICSFNYADRQAIYSVFPLVECDFHLSPLQLGLLWFCLRRDLRHCRAAGGNARRSHLQENRYPRRARSLEPRLRRHCSVGPFHDPSSLPRHRRPRRITLLPCLYVHWRRLSSR